MSRAKYNKGFTLIELSIVIVIIGLIVAGVVGGQSLVEQTKLRKVITDVEAIKIATRAFMLEYDAIPGDMNNSASYWPGVLGGNGDGILTSGTESNRFGCIYQQPVYIRVHFQELLPTHLHLALIILPERLVVLGIARIVIQVQIRLWVDFIAQ